MTGESLLPGGIIHALGVSKRVVTPARESLTPPTPKQLLLYIGEIEKYQKHESHVEHVGGRFYPLVTETLGVWTPSSLLTLRTITASNTIHSGLTIRQATHNLYSNNYRSNSGRIMPKCCYIQHFSLLPAGNIPWVTG